MEDWWRRWRSGKPGRQEDMPKLIVGLGNPGTRYEGTRHNVGFEVIRRLVGLLDAAGPRSRFKGNVWEANSEGTKLLLLAPETFMNLSGQSVRAAVDFFKVPLEHLLVICDDFALPLGRVRFRPDGSSGGHRGLANIIDELGTESFPRLRIGIGPLPPGVDPVEFVLGRFSEDELGRLNAVIAKACPAILDWVKHGISYCMDRYNGPQWLADSLAKPTDRPSEPNTWRVSG
ncbi:MAG: aminoacyl-tRNA hydrolase [Thermoguttaceae bacterium]|nr:aminoacyl-tRNA hydrolase [Thermoguttaceae bacterium]